METRANHVLIGAFTVLMVAFLMLFALWLGKASLEREWDRYIVMFNEAVTGLTVGSAVQFNGIQVGEVRDLAIDPNNPSRVLATIRVAATAPVKTDTVAKLALTGLTGVAVIQLSGGSPDAPLLQPNGDGSPPVIIAEASALQKLMASSEDIATTAGEILIRVRTLLDDANTRRITNMVANLEATSETLADARGDIRRLLTEAADAGAALNRTLERAEQAFARIDRAAGRLDAEVIDKLPAAVEDLQDALQRVEHIATSADQLLERNRDTLDEFTQQGLAQVGPTLDELRRLLRDLRRITEQVEQGPARYLIDGQSAPEFEP